MTTGLPFRMRTHNRARTTSAPAAVTAIVSRPISADASRPIVRMTLAGDLEHARGRALALLDACLRRQAGPLDVELQDQHGALLFTASRTGGA